MSCTDEYADLLERARGKVAPTEEAAAVPAKPRSSAGAERTERAETAEGAYELYDRAPRRSQGFEVLGGDGKPRGAGTTAKKPSKASPRKQPFDYFMVLDFEATCEENESTFPNEIIEFPVVLVDAETLTIVDTFQSFVRPVAHPKLSKFCTQLTGITQSQVDSAPTLTAVVAEFEKWHKSRIPSGKSFIFATDGPWDMRNFMYKQAVQRDGVQFPPMFYEWIDVRKSFADFMRCSQGGIRKMLGKLGLEQEGRLHSGVDDATNIARVCIELVKRGCILRTKSTIAHGDVTVPVSPSTPPGTNGVETNGAKHNGHAAAAAEPSDGKASAAKKKLASLVPTRKQHYDYLMVLDFEATCEQDQWSFPHEIIEFPVVLVDTSTLAIVSTFRSFVRPVRHPKLTEFCTQLTGITQSQVDGAPTLPTVVSQFEKWHKETIPEGKSAMFVTDGPWDMRNFMYKEAVMRDGVVFPPVFYEWINLRKAFADFMHCPSGGIEKMMGRLDLAPQGRLHSGIDDATNIARIAIELMQRGCSLRTKSTISSEDTLAAMAAVGAAFAENDPDIGRKVRSPTSARSPASKSPTAGASKKKKKNRVQ